MRKQKTNYILYYLLISVKNKASLEVYPFMQKLVTGAISWKKIHDI